MPLASSKSSRTSFPATIESSTKVTRTKAAKRRASLRSLSRDRSPAPPGKENSDVRNETPTASLGPTPYWKVAEERDGLHSPRETRSAKKKKQRLPPFASIAGAVPMSDNVVLNFSPPDQKANRRREEEHLAQRENLRDTRVQTARDQGQLLIFSPSGRPRQSFDEESRDKELNDRHPQSFHKGQHQEVTSVRPHRSFDEEIQEKASFNIREAQHEMLLANVGGQQEAIEHLKASMDKLLKSKSFDEETKSEKLLMLEAQCHHLSAAHTTLDGRIKEVEQEKKVLDEQVIEMKERYLVETTKLEAQVAAAQREAERHQTDRVAIASKIEELRENFLVEKTRMESELSALQRESDIRMTGLDEKRKELEQDKLTLVSRVEELENELGRTKDALAEMKSVQCKLASDKEHLVETKTRLDKDLENLRDENRMLLKEVQGFKEDVLVLEEQLLPEAEAQRETYKKELAKQKEATKFAQAKLEESQRLIDQLEHDLDELEKEKEDERVNFQTLNEESTKAFTRKDNEIHSLSHRRDELADDLEREQKKRETTEKSLLQKETEIEEISRALHEAEKNLHVSEHAIKQKDMEMKTKIDELTSELEVIVADLKNEKEAHRIVNSKLEEKEVALSNLTEKIEASVSAMETKDAEILQLTTELEAIATDLEQEQIRRVKLEKALQEKQVEMSAAVEEMQAQMDTLEDKLALADADRSMLQDKLKEVQDEAMALSSEREAALHQNTDATRSLQSTEKELLELQGICKSLRRGLQAKDDQIQESNLIIQTLKSEQGDTLKRLESFDHREEELFRKLRESDRVRRDLHNKVMQLSGNIRVFVRVRPELPGERQKASRMLDQNVDQPRKRKHDVIEDTPFKFPGIFDRDGAREGEDLCKNFLEMLEPSKDRGGLKERRKKWRFGFDHVFAPSTGQDELWEATEPLVQSTIDGYNVCLFAYGQTGSGKTFTMLGDQANPGIISRAVMRLFDAKREIESMSKGRTKVTVSVELLEIYNERIRDLLAPGADQNLRVTSNAVEGNILATTTSSDEVMEILEIAQSRRCVKATESNTESSRSHMVFTIHFIVKSEDGVSRVGKLHVCDLAGSERLNKSGANSNCSLLKETQAINSSLSVLSNVIEKLQQGNANVPFRESKLTMLLQNSLGGNSKTLAIVCCNPLASHFHESLCSLRFADKVNKVELKASSNFTA